MAVAHYNADLRSSFVGLESMTVLQNEGGRGACQLSGFPKGLLAHTQGKPCLLHHKMK